MFNELNTSKRNFGVKVKSDDFLALPAPRVAIADIQAVIRAERG